MAPAAKVFYYASDGSILTDPLVTAGLRAVEDLVRVISMSYGQCEAALGAADNAVWNSLWLSGNAI